ncbi:MAG: hypothetical protein K5682_09445 [Lachnospiraceae bacterium]|nr:hypothetical protein [Lachnospiraceae bacterium]
MKKQHALVLIGIMLISSAALLFPIRANASADRFDSNTALGAGRSMGIYNRPGNTGDSNYGKVTATEVFGEDIGKPLDNFGQGVTNAVNGIGKFFSDTFSPNPPTPIQQDLKNSVNFGNTFSGIVYSEGGKYIVKEVTKSPALGNVAGDLIGGAGDAYTLYSDGKELLNGGTTGYDSESMNMLADGITGTHAAITIDKYVAKVAKHEEFAKSFEVGGNMVGVSKEMIKSKTIISGVNAHMDKYGNPLEVTDMMIRMDKEHIDAHIIAGASPESTLAYIMYGNKKDGRMNAYLNKNFFNSDAKKQSQAIQEARKKAAAARAKRLGQMNQRGKRNINEGKPVIYLYPVETCDVTVTFAYPELLTEVIPSYPAEWTVTASPEGSLTTSSGESYPYLFYESETPFYYFQREEGFYLPAEDRDQVMLSVLKAYGLTPSEALEFVEYWDEYLEKGVDYRMYPQLNAICEEAMPITITPAPDSILRIWMLFEEHLEGDTTTVKEPTVTPLKRKGFTVVEWGGMVR